jgi:hypothetical protein
MESRLDHSARAVDGRLSRTALYFRQRYEHQFLYDWATVKNMLLGAGFETVSRAAFGRGCHCLPVIPDDEKYEWESPHVEASKSGTGSEG